MRFFLFFLLSLLVAACADNKPAPRPPATDAVTMRVDSLKAMARPGDLLFRLGDDMTSYTIRMLSEKDPSYSHVGVVSDRNGQIGVQHIAPDEHGGDTIQFQPIDSFINPSHNLFAGLYRYRLSPIECANFLNGIAACKRSCVRFDYWYDLGTNNKLYCSELIAKSLEKASAGRIKFEEKRLPEPMLRLMYAYFANVITDTARIRNGKFISLDHLYLVPSCDSIYKIALRNEN